MNVLAPEMRFPTTINSLGSRPREWRSGSLPKINTGEEAVYGDVRLPKNFSLIYASTDTLNDGIANKMLSLADMQSRELLNYVIRDRPQQNLDRIQGKPFSRLRVWQRS